MSNAQGFNAVSAAVVTKHFACAEALGARLLMSGDFNDPEVHVFV